MRVVTWWGTWVTVLALAGCVVQPKSQGLSTYVAPDFNRAQVQAGGIALLPVVAGVGVEGYRRPFGDAMNVAAGNILSNGKFLTWQETMQRLNEADLIESYQQAIASYTATSIIPKRLIQAMADATGVEYFLYVSLNSPVSETHQRRSSWGGGNTSIETRIGVSASGQLWASRGDIVWEGLGSSEVHASTDAFQLVSDADRSLESHSLRAATALINAVVGQSGP